MHFCPERLIQVRESLHINKAEAARRLNLSAMAYGRYERGEREPSYQYAFYIAYTFHCNLDFLYDSFHRCDLPRGGLSAPISCVSCNGYLFTDCVFL